MPRKKMQFGKKVIYEGLEIIKVHQLDLGWIAIQWEQYYPTFVCYDS